MKYIECSYVLRYYAEQHVKLSELEVKNLQCKDLVTGRQLYDMGKRAQKNLSKAMGFTSQKWDFQKRQPKKSGDTVEDVIEFVRWKMYFFLKDKVDPEIDNFKLKGEEKSLLDKLTAEKNGKVEEDESEDGNSNCSYQLSKLGESDDTDNKKPPAVPDEYFFPSFFTFVLWGPFANPNDQLHQAVLEDRVQGKAKSRNQKREDKKETKDLERQHDGNHERGLTADQKINIEGLCLQSARLEMQQREVKLASISMQSTILESQLAAAERRAERRCPEYDPEHILWKKVDELIEEQQLLKKLVEQESTTNVTTVDSSNFVDMIQESTKRDTTSDTPIKKNLGKHLMIHHLPNSL